MRRLVIYLPVAAFCFFVGLSASSLRLAANSSPGLNEPVVVSLCALEADPQRYDGKLVRVTAVLHRDMEPYLYDSSCGASAAQKSPRITIPGDDSFVVPGWAVETLTCANAPNVAAVGAQVTVVGVFEADYHASNEPPGVRHPRITPRSIIQLLPPSQQKF
jgi:hypothetical protein